MKTLLVLRHGKSSWADSSLDDHDRPLKGRGKRAAKKIARALCARGLEPDLVISSTAKRARSTARRVLKTAAGYDCEIVKSSELYFSGVGRQLVTVARHARDGDQQVMIVGHNPDFEDLVATLTGRNVRLTTANLAVIDLAIDSWSDLPAARGTLRFVIRPRELP